MKAGNKMSKFTAGIITKETKPGKGISKDEPEKRRFFLFFELLGAKFTKLIGLNFIYFLTLIPLIVGLYFSFTFNVNIKSASDLFKYPVFTFNPDIISLIILLVSCFITGPATAGFTYVLRNMQRREHTWVISDFFSQFKKNYIQGMLMSFIDMVCYILLYIAFNFYLYIMPLDAPEMGSMFPAIAAGFVAFIAIIFTWAHYYIYTMMVTFRLSFSKLFKNSLIFAFAKPLHNIMISAISVAVLVGLLYLTILVPLISGMLIPTILLSFLGFMTVFSIYPTIDKIMLQKVNRSGRILNTHDDHITVKESE